MMTNAERAKIFAPFDAMKGLHEALRDREERHLRVQKHDVSEEDAARNSRVLLQTERGMAVEVRCYSGFHDVVKRGRVTQIDRTAKMLKLNEDAVWFDDIYAIKITDPS